MGECSYLQGTKRKFTGLKICKNHKTFVKIEHAASMIKGKNNANTSDDEYDKIIESLFVTYNKKADNDKILKEFDIENYSDVMYPIEFTIASYYVEHYSLTDKKLEKTILSLLKKHDKKKNFTVKNIKKTKNANLANYKHLSEKTKDTLIARLKKAVIHTLQQRATTRDEILLCFEYILYSIDNRSWIPGEKGYLDWIANMFDLLVGERKQEFDYFYEDLAQNIGIEPDFLKGNIPDNVEIDEKGLKTWEKRNRK